MLDGTGAIAHRLVTCICVLTACFADSAVKRSGASWFRPGTGYFAVRFVLSELTVTDRSVLFVLFSRLSICKIHL